MTSVLASLRGRNSPQNQKKLSAALTDLGPSHIKLGQFLATRDDLIGPELARDLSQWQDRLPPFSMAEAKKAVKESLGAPVEDLFAEFGPPVDAGAEWQTTQWATGPAR